MATLDQLDKTLKQASQRLPPPRVTAALRKRIARDLQPAHGPPATVRWFLGIFAAGLMLGVAVLMGQRIERAPAEVLLLVTVTLVGFALATFLGIRRAERVRMRTRIAAALAPPLVFAAIVLMSQVFSTPSDGEPMGLFNCMGRGFVLAIAPLLALILGFRRSDPFTPQLTGALIGGWAGLAGAVGLTLACPSGDLLHLALAHGAAIAGGALIGAVVGKRLLRP